MKTIIATTDFSKNANQAVQFAAQLARSQQAKLILCHAFRFWPTNPAETGIDFPLSAQAMRDESQQALKQIAHSLHQAYGEGLSISCVTKEGYPIPAIQTLSREANADLLVMCTVGSAPQSAQIMGSVASAMTSETSVPLLLVPPSVHYGAMNSVVLGIDLDTPPDVVVFDTALRLVRQLGCMVNVLCINDNPTDATVQGRAEHIRRLMTQVPHTLTIQPGKEVYNTLLTFAHDNKADMLMMMPQTHNWFFRLFNGGETERMARLTDIPLLVVV